MPILLFAEASDGWWIAFSTLCSVIGGAVVWMANFFINRQNQQRMWKQEDQRTIVQHQDEAINRLVEEVGELRLEVGRLREEVTQAKAHMMYLEGILESKRIPFRRFPWTPPGSGEVTVPPDDPGGP